MFNCMQEVLMP